MRGTWHDTPLGSEAPKLRHRWVLWRTVSSAHEGGASSRSSAIYVPSDCGEARNPAGQVGGIFGPRLCEMERCLNYNASSGRIVIETTARF